jgi:magnesium transporter
MFAQIEKHIHTFVFNLANMSPKTDEIARSAKSGVGPEALIHVGDRKDTPVSVRLIDYDQAEVREKHVVSISECSTYATTETVSWFDIDGIHDPAVTEAVGKEFGIHMLVLEDIMNSTSRPKIEIFDDYVFVTLKMLEFDSRTSALNIEQLSLIVSDKYLLMFQERPGDSFNSIRERIRTSKGKVRSKNGYYLAYMILDVVIDNYIIVSEQFARHLERIESMVLRKPNERTMQSILAVRKELLDFKRNIDPLKEAINTMIRELDDDMAKYYRDLYDHIIFESENLATYRETIVNLLDLYHSNLSMKMNQVMKVLTIITTIFVPLTFIVGVYGMNFDNMPELRTRNGYFVVLSFMFLLVCGMLIYFRKKRWL